MFDTHDTWFITCRTFQARKLMTPSSPLIRDVCGGVLAKAASMSGVRLHAYVFLSNHFHLIIHARGPRIATFMKYLLGNLSKKLGPLCKPSWWSRFWERRYTATPILDEAALEDRLCYVLAHGVKEGLVARTREWEGLHCAEQLMDEKPREFRWFNWTRRWRTRHTTDHATKPRAARYDEGVGETVRLELEPLPHWAAEPPPGRQQRMRELVAEVERLHAQRGPPLGVDAVRRQTTERSRRRKRSPQPLCHGSSPEARSHFKALYRAFRDAFLAAAKKWLSGDLGAEFPSGSFKPYVYEVRNV
ncbi:MAG: hypothetical protein AB1938_22230 [Myxococcota bacterium]